MTRPERERGQVDDEVAQKLEAAGLWRRAAARWLTVMAAWSLTDAQRVWVCQRRAYCLSQVAPAVPPARVDFAGIARAAKATQARMGLSRPNGEAFRLKGVPAKRKKAVGSARAPADEAGAGDDEAQETPLA